MNVRLSAEVKEALSARRAVAALETSVVAQGLPPPHNAQAARSCEEAVRRGGAVPAAIAVIEGEVRVGLTAAQMERLADPNQNPCKLACRDLAAAIALRSTGGTTVSATCAIAAAAGIRVFATGGIGGVHRGFPPLLDISQDWWAVSRFPVAVVCAGAKSVLDLPKTFEALEALGVPVIGVGTSELPAFYSADSGLALDWRVENAVEAARILTARLDSLRHGGMIFAVPPPRETAIPGAEVEALIASALQVAADRGIRGAALTPFLLGELVRSSGGKTLAANLGLLLKNAAFAGELARADADLRAARS